MVKKLKDKKFDPKITNLDKSENTEPKCQCSCGGPGSCAHCAKGA